MLTHYQWDYIAMVPYRIKPVILMMRHYIMHFISYCKCAEILPQYSWTNYIFCIIIPVGSHEDFDVATRVKPIQLVDQLQHGPLYLIGAPITITEPSTCTYIYTTRKYICRPLPTKHEISIL